MSQVINKSSVMILEVNTGSQHQVEQYKTISKSSQL